MKFEKDGLMTTYKLRGDFSYDKRVPSIIRLMILVLMSSVFLGTPKLHAQQSENKTYPTWRKGYINRLNQADKEDRPLLERSIAQAYFNQAEQTKSFPLMGESLAHLLRAQMKVANDSISQYLSYVDRMEDSGETIATTSICDLLRGNMYLSIIHTIPRIKRPEYQTKILTSYRQALAHDNEQILVTTSSRDFMPMINIGSTNRDAKSYPLYGVICRNVIAGMERLYSISYSTEHRHKLLKEMSAVYSHWIALNKSNGYNDMALMVQMDYCDWADRYHYELDKIPFPYLALPSVETYDKCVLLPELYFFLADKYRQKESEVDFKTAIDYYKLIINKYPKYRRTVHAKNELLKELAPSFELMTQDVFSTSDSLKIHISYRNLDKATLFLSAVESKKGKWTKKIPLKLKAVEDGTMQDTIIALAPCTYGKYTLSYKVPMSRTYKKYVSTQEEKKVSFCVSDLMIYAVKYPNGDTQLRLVDRYRGTPIPNGQIIVQSSPKKSPNQKERSYLTNQHGVVFMQRKQAALKVRAQYKQDLYLPIQSIYSGRVVLPKEKPYQRATLLTDRKLYRPGDRVSVTAIVYERTSDEATVLKKYPMSVELISPNGKVLQTEKGITDSMGVMPLSFSLPDKMMKGTCWLRTAHPLGYASIQVEEYVAPTYELTLQQMPDTLELPGLLNCRVLTKLLSDVPLKEVAIDYTLTGTPYHIFAARRRGSNSSGLLFPRPQKIAHGRTITDSQGSSSFTLLVDSIDAVKAKYASYSLSVVAVSPTGERHEAISSFIGHFPKMEVKSKKQKEEVELLPDSLRLPLWIDSKKLLFSKGSKTIMPIHTNFDNAILHIRLVTNKGVVEEKDIQVKNRLYKLEVPYKGIYGSSLTVQCSLVKEGTLYTEMRSILLPLQEKKLHLKWLTFRNNLLPGQTEKFQLQVLTPQGQPAEASLWLTMYDASTDAIASNTLPALLNYIRKRARVYEYNQYKRQSHAVLLFDWPNEKQVSLDFDQLLSPLGIVQAIASYNRTFYAGKRNSGQLSKGSTGLKIRGSASIGSAVPTLMESDIDEMDRAQPEAVADISLRKELLTTAFCYPILRTDSLGCITIPFKVPGDLTRWRMLGHIHTVDMMQNEIDTMLVSQRPLMVKPTKPRLLRVGDKASIAVTVSNLTNNKEKTKVILTLLDAVTKKKIERHVRTIKLDAKDQQEVTFLLREIKHSGELLCRVEATNRVASDGEQFSIVVESNGNNIVQTQPFMLMPGESVLWKQPIINGPVQHLSQSLHLTQGILFTALQQLPRIWEAGGEVSTIDLLNRYYALSMGRLLISKQPALVEWVTNQASADSMIHKQTDDLQLTPWEMEEEKQVKYWKRLAGELEINKVNYLTDSYCNQLMNMQQTDGSFAWYPGMESSLYVTFLVTNELIHLDSFIERDQGNGLGNKAREDNQKIIQRAKKWLDQQASAYVLAVKKNESNKKVDRSERILVPRFYPLQYLYLDSQLSDWSSSESISSDVRYLLDNIEKDPRKLNLRDKLFVSTIYLALHQNEPAEKMISSLNEYSLYSEQPSILLRAMQVNAQWQEMIQSKKGPLTAKRNNQELYLKALSIARTKHWYEPTAQADILAALLINRTWTVPQGTVLYQGDERMVISQESLQNGFVDRNIKPSIHRSNRLSNNSNQILWGSFVTQYNQTNKGHSVREKEGLAMTRSLYLMDDSGDVEKAQKLKFGMEIPQGSRITVLLQIDSPISLDMVQIEDHFAAGLMPVEQRSGYHWGGFPDWISSSWLNYCWSGVPFMVPSSYYEVNRSSVCFYINQIKRGHYSLQYQLVAQQRGVFQGTTAQLVSLFAPDYQVVASIEQIKIVARDNK